MGEGNEKQRLIRFAAGICKTCCLAKITAAFTFIRVTEKLKEP
jgi:hypothetical protein